MHISWARLASFCHLGVISDPLIVPKFHNETHDPNGQENEIYSIVKGRETLYRRRTVQSPAVVKSTMFLKGHPLEMAYFIKVGGGGAVKIIKTNYYKSSLVTNFAQIRSLIPIYKGMYTVCSYDTSVNRSHWYIYKQCNMCVEIQVIVKVMDNILIYPKTMKYSRPDLCTKATHSCQVLCCKHYISMYLDE